MQRHNLTIITSVLLLLLMTFPALAQDVPGDEPIGYGDEVRDTITDAAIYDWWRLPMGEGESVVIQMTGGDGLDPLLGILSPSGDLLQSTLPAGPDATVEMEFSAPAGGEYTIVATRVGNDQGDTTGDYRLRTARIGGNPAPVTAPDPYREVIFTCFGDDVANVLTLEFIEDAAQADTFRATLYGYDGFDPILRTTLAQPMAQPCAPPEDYPGETVTLPDGDIIDDAAVVRANYVGGADIGPIRLNVGSRERAAGRYVLVIEGFTIGRNGDRDVIAFGSGPLAREVPPTIYMLADKTTRLDPFIELVNPGSAVVVTCDDAGVRDCASVAPADALTIDFGENGETLIGGRFDAGMQIVGGTPEQQLLEFSGFDGRTYGGYTLVIVGELPPPAED